MRKTAVLTILCAGAGTIWAAQRYPVTGLVLKIDPAHRTFVASCTAIPGYMAAMVMPIPVRDGKALEALKPSEVVDFTLVVTKDDAYAENLHVHQYQSMELEPLQARRFRTLHSPTKPGATSDCRNWRARCWCPRSFIQAALCPIIASGYRTIWDACRNVSRIAWDATWCC